MMKEKLLKGLTEEQNAKVKACKNQEELLALAKEEGIELNDEQLEAVNGGACSNTDHCPPCPSCGSTNVKSKYSGSRVTVFKCKNCGKEFEIKSTE